MKQRIRERGLEQQIIVDSAGTGDWHIGSPPDSRAAAAALQRGYDLSDLRARQVVRDDFEKFDLILAMDRNNHRDLTALSNAQQREKVALFLSAVPHTNVQDVPDPYYGGADGFDHVLDLVEEACDAWLDQLVERHGLQAACK